MANPLKCKYCHVVTLEGFNESERKYYEQGTRQLHTRERCLEAKNRGGAGSSPPATSPPTPPIQDQKTNDIKAAQLERKRQHNEFIKNLQWNTKMLAHLVEIQGGKQAQEILDSMGFEEFREDQREGAMENDVL